ncbi:MAG: VWA domain-containing protein [Caldilineaceae bacterium SB0662_bin_9]|uniref:VWA domain-containing protein n=1 Tax=Caldilineaceae bacterium SB0662_bin_9 TaxID=2605258 RepID=A0A6B1DT71_9CHLR|nr:VWA domain-containing protein [Caldilineaceae bacterium SB0662_bin_9]
MQVVSLPARIGALAIRLRNSGLRAYVPYAAVGTVTCIVAILVAEIFVQAMQPPPVEVDPNDPLVIALLIDTSSSMEGEPIAEVRDASIRFLETWDRSNTHVAVIPFNTYASIVHPILAKEKPADPLIPELRRLEAAGGTAMLLGLQKAQEAFDSIDSSRNAVMLFTDGMPSRPGPTQRLATEMRGRGTVIVAIGSTGANYGYLEQLTGHSDNVFTTRLGDFASAFDRAAKVIAASSFGTATTSQGLTVVFVVSLFLAAAMLATENMWGLRGNWWRDMWWLPVAGGVAGYVGGLVGEYVLRLGIVTWGLVGLSCGAALGLTDLAGDQFTGLRSLLRIPPKSRRGAIFGLIGGLVGGIVFALFFRNVSLDSTGGELQALFSRLVGFAILGLAIGLAIKVGQELLKNTWLLGLSKGFYEGKQYILAKASVSVGRSGNNDINLNQETDIGDHVGHFELVQDTWHFVPASREAVGAVTVDRQAVADRVHLADGSSIRFGNTEFVFQSRENPGTVSQSERWALVGDDEEFELPMQDRILLGSDDACDIVIRDSSVDGRHAVLEFSGQDLKLTTLGGDFVSVNDVTLPRDGQSLKQGDFIMLGTVELGLVKLFDA